jgi:protein SCO1
MNFRISVLFLFSIIIFTACNKSESPTEAVKRFKLKGEVISVDKAAKKASVKHEKVEGYMEAMTMDFPIREDWVWGDLSAGSEIQADLVVDDVNGKFWLEKIAIVAAPNPNNPVPPINEKFSQIGSALLDFSLTNQDGKTISSKDFKGKALAITFIYSRCPLPEYCILMSKNFSDLANQLSNNADFKDKIRLLSISFDPTNDTPEKLKQYGLGYLGKDAKPDFTVWQLATGKDEEVKKIAEAFGLRYEIDQNNKTQFNHSLRTIVVSPEGKVTKIFPGSDWTTSQLMDELVKTLNTTN